MQLEDTALKVCPKCGEIKPLTPEHWGKNKASPDGFAMACKPCTRQQSKSAYHANSQARRDSSNKWRTANLEKARASAAETAARDKTRRQTDPVYDAACREKARLDTQKRRKANPQKFNEAARRQREKTPTAILSARVQACSEKRAMRETRTETYGEALAEKARRRAVLKAQRQEDDSALEALEAQRLAARMEALAAILAKLDAGMARILAEDDKIKARHQRKRERLSKKARDPLGYAAGLRATRQRRRAREKNADGTFNAADVKRLWANQKGKCYYCGSKLEEKGDAQQRFHVDHFVPLYLGGSNYPANLVLACPPCNNTKSGVPPEEYLLSVGRLL